MIPQRPYLKDFGKKVSKSLVNQLPSLVLYRKGFQNVILTQLKSRSKQKKRQFIKSLEITSNKNRLHSDRHSPLLYSPEQKQNFSFFSYFLLPHCEQCDGHFLPSVSTQRQAGHQMSRSVPALQQFKRFSLQLCSSPGLSPASAFGGQSLLISRMSFFSTMWLQKKKNTTD